MSFKRTLWEARLVDNYSKATVLPRIATKPTEVTATGIVFNRVGTTVIGDYTGSITWNDMDTTSVTLAFEHRKYFADKVDDIDKAQTNLDLIDGFAKVQVAKLAKAAESYAFGKYIDGAGFKKLDQTVVGISGISEGQAIYNLIVDLSTALGEKDVPINDAYVLVSYDAINKMCKESIFTRHPEYIENGIVSNDKINGLTVIVSSNIPANTLLAVHPAAIGFGNQIDKIEGMRLENSFGDGVCGLNVAGAAVLNPDGVAVATYNIPVVSISLPATATVKVGETITLAPVVNPGNTTQSKGVTFASGTTSKATVTDAGVVTGVAAGTSVITVTSAANNSITATCTVTVTSA